MSSHIVRSSGTKWNSFCATFTRLSANKPDIPYIPEGSSTFFKSTYLQNHKLSPT